MTTSAPSPAPSTPSTAPLTISGAAVLTPGLTSQLTATNSSGTVVTSSASWQSQATNIATVSSTGLVTAVGAGSTTITASVGSSSGQVTITVQPAGTATTTLSSCQAITSPGSYALNGDLAATPTGSPCLRVSSVASVQLDCRGHVVPGVSLSNVTNVTISNCIVPNHVDSSGSYYVPINVNGGFNVTVTNCTVTAVIGTAISFLNGANNQIVHNTLSGGYDGGPTQNATDDGIGLYYETGDTIRDNTISSFFDTALEGENGVANTTIANNTITNIGTAALGAYWCSNWTNNVIQGNSVSMAPTLARVEYDVGAACGSTPAPAGFSGNHFVGNVFRNPVVGVGYYTAIARMTVRMPASALVSSNVLQGNDFGTNDGPQLTPFAGFTDGGGNICGPQNPQLSNFVCTGGGAFTFAKTAGTRR